MSPADELAVRQRKIKAWLIVVGGINSGGGGGTSSVTTQYLDLPQTGRTDAALDMSGAAGGNCTVIMTGPPPYSTEIEYTY